jgi:hypothetical protein
MADSFSSPLTCKWSSHVSPFDYSDLDSGEIHTEPKMQFLPALRNQERQTGRKAEGPFHNKDGLFQNYEGTLKMLDHFHIPD